MAPGLVKFMMPVSLRRAISTLSGSSSGSTVMELGMSMTLSYLQVCGGGRVGEVIERAGD